MIVVSGGSLSRAWCAVALASSDDDSRPVFYRSVLVEQYNGVGIRLTATDSYWLAQCWVPAFEIVDDLAGSTDPGLDVIADQIAIIRDEDHRVRDLMRHIARLTKDPAVPDVAINLTLNRYQPDLAEPALPGIEALTASFELPGRELVIAAELDGLGFPNWRPLLHGAERPGPGVSDTILSAWLINALSKIPRIVSADHIELIWQSNLAARWFVRDGRLGPNSPHGILAARTATPDPDNGTDPEPALSDVPSRRERHLAAI